MNFRIGRLKTTSVIHEKGDFVLGFSKKLPVPAPGILFVGKMPPRGKATERSVVSRRLLSLSFSANILVLCQKDEFSNKIRKGDE